MLRNASYFYNLGAARQFNANFDGAEAAYVRALELAPDLYRAHSSLVQLRRATPERNRVAELEALFARLGNDADAALHIGHALAKELEDLGEYPRAFEWLERATAAKRAAVQYDGVEDARLFAAAARTVSANAHGHPSDEPVFVIGMPRTGTTLVDRILSSHPDVMSAGELTDFALIVKRMTGTASDRVLDVDTLAASATSRFRFARRALHRQHAAADRSHAPLRRQDAAEFLLCRADPRRVAERAHRVPAAQSDGRVSQQRSPALRHALLVLRLLARSAGYRTLLPAVRLR